MNNLVWHTPDGHFNIKVKRKVYEIDSDLVNQGIVKLLNSCTKPWFTDEYIEPLIALLAEQGISFESEPKNQPGADIEITSIPT